MTLKSPVRLIALFVFLYVAIVGWTTSPISTMVVFGVLLIGFIVWTVHSAPAYQTGGNS